MRLEYVLRHVSNLREDIAIDRRVLEPVPPLGGGCFLVSGEREDDRMVYVEYPERGMQEFVDAIVGDANRMVDAHPPDDLPSSVRVCGFHGVYCRPPVERLGNMSMTSTPSMGLLFGPVPAVGPLSRLDQTWTSPRRVVRVLSCLSRDLVAFHERHVSVTRWTEGCVDDPFEGVLATTEGDTLWAHSLHHRRPASDEDMRADVKGLVQFVAACLCRHHLLAPPATLVVDAAFWLPNLDVTPSILTIDSCCTFDTRVPSNVRVLAALVKWSDVHGRDVALRAIDVHQFLHRMLIL